MTVKKCFFLTVRKCFIILLLSETFFSHALLVKSLFPQLRHCLRLFFLLKSAFGDIENASLS